MSSETALPRVFILPPPSVPPEVLAYRRGLSEGEAARRDAQAQAFSYRREAERWHARAMDLVAEAMVLQAECGRLLARVEELERQAAVDLVTERPAGGW